MSPPSMYVPWLLVTRGPTVLDTTKSTACSPCCRRMSWSQANRGMRDTEWFTAAQMKRGLTIMNLMFLPISCFLPAVRDGRRHGMRS